MQIHSHADWNFYWSWLPFFFLCQLISGASAARWRSSLSFLLSMKPWSSYHFAMFVFASSVTKNDILCIAQFFRLLNGKGYKKLSQSLFCEGLVYAHLRKLCRRQVSESDVFWNFSPSKWDFVHHNRDESGLLFLILSRYVTESPCSWSLVDQFRKVFVLLWAGRNQSHFLGRCSSLSISTSSRDHVAFPLNFLPSSLIQEEHFFSRLLHHLTRNLQYVQSNQAVTGCFFTTAFAFAFR